MPNVAIRMVVWSTVVATLPGPGRLIENGKSAGKAGSFTYPAPGPSILLYERPGWGPMPAGWEKGSLIYISAPLDRDLVAYGPASVDLRVSSDGAPDADLQVTLTVVRPDGQEMYLKRSWLRLSNRAIDSARSTPGRPVLLDTPEAFAPLPPNQQVLARVEINRFSFPLRRGNKLRIWIDTPSPTGA